MEYKTISEAQELEQTRSFCFQYMDLNVIKI